MAVPTNLNDVSVDSLTSSGAVTASSFVLDPDVAGQYPNITLPIYMGQPVVAASNRIVTSVNLTNVALTIAAQPDVPRNLTVTVTDTTPGITAGTLTVVGTNPAGDAITEAFSFASFVSGTAKVGTKIFASVTSATASGFTALGGAGDETIVVGIGNVIGLPFDIAATTAVKHVYFNKTYVASPTLSNGANTSGVNVSASTYDGSKQLLAFVNPAE